MYHLEDPGKCGRVDDLNCIYMGFNHQTYRMIVDIVDTQQPEKLDVDSGESEDASPRIVVSGLRVRRGSSYIELQSDCLFPICGPAWLVGTLQGHIYYIYIFIHFIHYTCAHT